MEAWGGENYRSISWSSISGKIYAEILVETVLRKTEGITGDEQEGYTDKGGR